LTGLFLLAVPVLIAGAMVALALRSNRARAMAAIVSQGVATTLVLISIAPTLAGGSPLVIEWSWAQPIDQIAFRIDALGAFFLAWSLPMTLIGTIYAVGYLQPYFDKGRNGGWHFALLNMTALAFVLVYAVQNALVFLLGWEIAAVAAWLLVIWDYRNQKIRFAGFNYLVSTHVGLFVLVAAFMLLHSKTGSMDFAAFGVFLSHKTPIRGTLFLLLGVAFALKSAFFPFHTWLPRAHSAAPAHVSALMSGVIHKAGLFGFLRFTLLSGRPEEWMGWSVLVIGLLSAVFGALNTTSQRDLKRMLGYSSTENVGIAAIGFGIGYLGWTWNNPMLAVCGFAGGLLHILNHALFKCLLFYAAGAIYRATHTIDLERLGGLAKRIPRTAILFLIGALAICGFPPLNGFTSEFLIYAGLLTGHAPTAQASAILIAAAAILAFVGAVGALAMTRAFGLTFLGVAREPKLVIGDDAPPSMLAPMIIHALGVIVVGVAPELGIAAITSTLKLFPFGGVPAAVLEPLAAVVWASRALAFVMLVTGVIGWRRARTVRRTATWGCAYPSPSPRMQYTGSSFSEHFTEMFDAVLPRLRRERLSDELFPVATGELHSHHVDVVERRMFQVLNQGQDFISNASEKIPEQPRFAFAAGLVVLVIIGAVIAGVTR
jgi:hydrogenase-4 component B